MHGAGKRGGARDIAERRRGGIDLHQIKRAGLQCEAAADRHRRAGSAGARREAAARDQGVADRAGAAERAPGHGESRVAEAAVDRERAGADRERADAGVSAREGPAAAAGLRAGLERDELADVEAARSGAAQSQRVGAVAAEHIAVDDGAGHKLEAVGKAPRLVEFDRAAGAAVQRAGYRDGRRTALGFDGGGAGTRHGAGAGNGDG